MAPILASEPGYLKPLLNLQFQDQHNRLKRKIDMRFADTSRSDRALARFKSPFSHGSEAATSMETKYIEPNWKDAERVARFFDWAEDKVPGARKRLNGLRNTALFKEIQTDIKAEAGVRQEDRLAQDEHKRARMRQLLQAQALRDGPLPEDEQTRLLEQLPPEDKKAYRVAQRRDAVRDMNPAYANVSDEDLSGLTKRIDNDVGMSKIILPQREEVGSEEWDIPRELLDRTSDAVEPNTGARYECLQALFQDDSLVDSRLQLRSGGAGEEPRPPSSTPAGSQHGRSSRRRLWAGHTEAHGAYELPEPVGDDLLRLPPSAKNKDGLPNLCGPEEQQRLARWKAFRETSAKKSTLDQDMTLSNARSTRDYISFSRNSERLAHLHDRAMTLMSPDSMPPVTEQSDTLSADHFGTHERLGSEHATEDDSDEESSGSDFQITRRTTRATQPSIKPRTDLQKPHGRALPQQSPDGSHPAFQCSICGNPYADKNGLRRHTRKNHPEQAQDSKPSLSRFVSPTKEGRERCKFCGGGPFASNSTLFRHQRDQHPDRSAEFEHGRPRPSTAALDTDLPRLRDRSTTRSKRRDSATTFRLGGFKPIDMRNFAAGTRAVPTLLDDNLAPNRERSTKLSDDDVSVDPAVDDRPEAAAATTSSSATKPEASVPSSRKRPAADSGDEKEKRKAMVNTRNNSELQEAEKRKRRERRRLLREMISRVPPTDAEEAGKSVIDNGTEAHSEVKQRKARRRLLKRMLLTIPRTENLPIEDRGNAAAETLFETRMPAPPEDTESSAARPGDERGEKSSFDDMRNAIAVKEPQCASKSPSKIEETKRKERRRLLRETTLSPQLATPPTAEKEEQKSIINAHENSTVKESETPSKIRERERKERRRALREMTLTPKSFAWFEELR